MTAGIAATLLAAILAAPPGDGTNDARRSVLASVRGIASSAAVQPNDNTAAAGTLADGLLTLNLRVATGLWRPHGSSGPALRIEAFGEVNGALSVPGPLLRVSAGTEVLARVRNELGTSVRVHGFCDPGLRGCVPADIGAGETRELRFRADRAGTYRYWATSTGMPLQFRASEDAQLSGALIVDPADAAIADRVFVITEWTSLSRAQLREIAAQDDPGAAFLELKPDAMFLINGLAWPHTERLRYTLRERVRWRVINLSTQVHPMHLHGFYFDVDGIGDGVTETVFEAGRQPHVVTQVLQVGATMTMTWTPEREGNWLFHCHVMTHVSPMLHVDGSARSTHHGSGHAHDPGAGMTGMVLGITVTKGGTVGETATAGSRQPHARRFSLVMQAEANRFGSAPAYGFVLEGSSAAPGAVPVPGPTLVLTRGEPVEITLVNRMPESTSIHWHGMELDSFYDGVHGWSGAGGRLTPLIEPGRSFVVRFTPPRTGTFMYHTHLHDNRQLTSGLYGAMLVLEPEERFDAATDHVLVMGRGGPDRAAPVVVNGRTDPQFVWKAGMRHRIRLINITPGDVLAVSLQQGDAAVTWQALTKDGAPLPPRMRDRAAAKQLVAVGETYDFEYLAPPGRHNLWLEVRSPGGRWQAQAQVIVK